MMAQVCLPACCSAKSRLRRAIGERRSPSVVGRLVAESSGSWIWPGGEAGQGALQVRPCKLGRRIHAAHAPALPPHPALDRSLRLTRHGISTTRAKAGRFARKAEAASQPPLLLLLPFFLIFPWWNGDRNLSMAGWVGGAGVSAAWMPRPSPQGRVYGVPRPVSTHPAKPRKPPFSGQPTPPRRGSAVRRLPPKARFPRKK